MNRPEKLPFGTSDLPTASPQFINLHDEGDSEKSQSLVEELTHGLLEAQAVVSPKFFYDELGSSIFESITLLPEYYPTRTEAGIFEASYALIAKAAAASGIKNACLIDLGAGNCAKASALIPHLKPGQYVPVDISVDFLKAAAENVQTAFPALDIIGLGMDFSGGVSLPGQVQNHDRVYFYPGSSLGNFTPSKALEFLRQIADPAQGKASGLLLGIDLVKDTERLVDAYDDALGVTGAFNKNLLRNVNALLQSDFDVRQWKHVALFNTEHSRIEMHLEANLDLAVRWQGHERHFNRGERIHTECSYKYTLDGMTEMLGEAGFAHVEHWTDPDKAFAVFWAAV